MFIETIAANQVPSEREAGALLLDVRSPGEFRGGHVRGAINLPLEAVTAAKVGTLRGPEAARRVVLLCAAGKRAAVAAERLGDQGLALLVVAGGVAACAQAGLPLERTADGVISIERQVRIAAGTLVLAGVVLGTFVHPGFYGLSGFIGAGLVFAGVTDWCGLGLLLARAPWNR
ncbi:sulfurtransferase [Verrucomicrobiota bacterium]|nr:sulfurtransferase [Verrucomicrobiota bacterium]